MATQYYFLVSCKKITDTEWTMGMQADSGEIPMSIVHPDLETDEVLTTNPITRTIAEVKVMTNYLRQLNRHGGRGAVGHNDSVIRNIGQRLLQLQLGQQITVKISYFEHKGLRSGLYEINSLGVSPPINRAQPLTATLSQEQQTRVPQVLVDAVTSLENHVNTLQRELHAAQRILREYGAQLEAQDKQIQQLSVENNRLRESSDSETAPTQASGLHPQDAVTSQTVSPVEEADEEDIDTELEVQDKQIQQLSVENNQLRKSSDSETTPTQSSDSRPQEAATPQPNSPVEEADEKDIDTETRSLFQQFLKSSRFSEPQRKPSTSYPPKNRGKGS